MPSIEPFSCRGNVELDRVHLFDRLKKEKIMARLINAEILRSSPNGPHDGADLVARTNVEILETQGDWTRVRNGADEGWVPTTSVDAAGTSAGGAGPFDENTFADLCVLHSLTYDVNPIIVSALRNFALA